MYKSEHDHKEMRYPIYEVKYMMWSKN